MAVDLRKLEHLVAIAEEGSFTQAARRLHLSQQALSSSIKALERQIGVALLDRSTTPVTVLAPGRALIEDAHVLQGMARSAVARARRVGRGQPEVLRLGHTPAVTGEEITALVCQARTDAPELSTQAYQRFPAELTSQLLAGDLDIGLCRGMSPAHGLTRTTLTHHRLHVAMRVGHRFGDRERLRLDELAEQPIMVWGSPGTSGYTDMLIDVCRRAGFEPRMERNPVQGTPPVTAVLGTDHVALVTAPPGRAAGGQVRVVELAPPSYVPLHALIPHHVGSPAREAFVAAVSD